jgi:hypothetical protein
VKVTACCLGKGLCAEEKIQEKALLRHLNTFNKRLLKAREGENRLIR